MSLRKQATSGFIWTFSMQFGSQLIGFIVSMILARILLPEEFGLIGMIAIFISIGQALVDTGLTQSLIRLKKLKAEDYSTVFFFNLISSVLIYVLIFSIAPIISKFYGNEILIDIIRLYCVVFIIKAFSAVQEARLTKFMNFRVQTLISIPSLIVGGGAGITMAHLGFGVWALVWSQIISATVHTVLLWITSNWIPKPYFSKKIFFKHFNFGYKLTLSSLLEVIFRNLYLVVIGRFYSPAQVGFYSRADTMKQLPVATLTAAINKVTYPLFSKIQEDSSKLRSVYSKLMQAVMFVVAPAMIIFAVLATPAFRFLFTAKWLPAVPYFQLLCITGILYPMQVYNLNILKVKGRSDLFLKIQIVKKILVTISILITFKIGISALIIGQIITSIIDVFINAKYTGRYIQYSIWAQLKDLFPILVYSLFTGGIIYIFNDYINFDSDFIRILIGGIFGLITYISINYIFKTESLFLFSSLVMKRNIRNNS
jgi:teichuronic acid exporter